MLRKESLTEIMIEEHGKIYDSFAQFRFDSEKDIKKAFRFFDFFKKQEIEHIKIENKLFKVKLAPVKITTILLKQHDKIEELTMKVYNDIYNRRDSTKNAEILQEFLKAHLRIEEKIFYPELDKKLNNSEIEKLRKEILRRMSKIRKNFFK